MVSASCFHFGVDINVGLDSRLRTYDWMIICMSVVVVVVELKLVNDVISAATTPGICLGRWMSFLLKTRELSEGRDLDSIWALFGGWLDPFAPPCTIKSFRLALLQYILPFSPP